MDRRIDLDLKRVYQETGAAHRPAVALPSVASALKIWIQNFESAIKKGVPRADII